MDEWFVLANILSFTGACTVVRLVVNAIKDDVDTFFHNYLKVHVRTFYVALCLAYLIIYGGNAVMGSLTAEMAFAGIFNGFLVAVTTGKPMGTKSQ